MTALLGALSPVLIVLAVAVVADLVFGGAPQGDRTEWF